MRSHMNCFFGLLSIFQANMNLLFQKLCQAAEAKIVAAPTRSSAVVCAWCHPPGKDELIGEASHGICARHLKELILSLQNSVPRTVGE